MKTARTAYSIRRSPPCPPSTCSCGKIAANAPRWKKISKRFFRFPARGQMAYHFPLDAVLRFRRSQEHSERLKLEAIVSEHARTRALLDQVTRSFCESRRRFQQNLGDAVSGAELHFEAMLGKRAIARRESLRVRLAELDQRRSAQLQQYLQARRNR